MQPLEALLPAIYTALTTPDPLELEGQEVPVREHLPTGFAAPLYVLIHKPDANRMPGTAGCRIWSVTVLLDCVSLHQPGEVSSGPADALASLVHDRLESVLLPLPGGYQMSAATVENINSLEDQFDGEQTDVHRYVRMRFKLYLNF